jgi:ArsR family transcriptional regulator
LRIFVHSNITAVVNQLGPFKANLFQALAHPTRLEILEALRGGELSVNAILAKVERDQANISQHLANLRQRGLVTNRKEGNQVFYSVRDPILFELLDLMSRFAAAHLNEYLTLLEQFKDEESRTQAGP